MINRDMRLYNFYTLGDNDEYGQPVLSFSPTGTIKMSINISSHSVQDNINYAEANYIGLTRDSIDDSYVIQYGAERLKVLYVNPKGKLKQVFMKSI